MTILMEAAAVERPKAQPWREGLASLFSSPLNTALTLIAALVIVFCSWQFFRWAVFDAAWSGGPEACQVRTGACWPFVVANARLMVFGVYPEAVLWRPALSLVLLAAVIVASMIPALWSWPLIVAWVATPAFVCALLAGVLTETRVSTNAWGGLPLTLLVWMIAYAGAFVLAVPLALAAGSAAPCRGEKLALGDLIPPLLLRRGPHLFRPAVDAGEDAIEVGATQGALVGVEAPARRQQRHIDRHGSRRNAV